MDLAPSAHRHGITDADIRHAIAQPLRVVVRDDAMWLVIGADRTGQRLLEVVVVDPDTDPVVIHAMELRSKFYRYLGQHAPDDRTS